MKQLTGNLARPFFVFTAILLIAPLLQADSLWLGNDHEQNAANVYANIYNTSRSGSILGEVDALAGSGIAWDGSHLFFVDRTGYFTKRSADGQTVLESFSIPSTDVGEDLAYDSKRQVLWRVSHRPSTLEEIDPATHMLLRAFNFPLNDSLPQSQGGLGAIGALGVAYDPIRDKLYVSFCASGCDPAVPGGLVETLDPNQLVAKSGNPFIFGSLTYPVPSSTLSDSDATVLFRSPTFLTGGLAYDPAHDSLWVGSEDVLREVDLTGNVLSLFFRPIPAGFTEGGFVDGLEFITSPPTFTLPNPVVEATGPTGDVVNFTVTAKNDDGDATVSCTPNSGSTFALGTTTVNCTATDAKLSGLTSTANFSVLVHDTTPPTLNLPGNVVANAVAPSGASITYIVSASDLVDPNPVISCTPPSGGTFAIGTTTVNCTAKDSVGNTSTGSFTVLVKAAADQINDLVALVNTFDLRHGIQNSLDVKLQNAESALNAANAGDRTDVCSLMSAFINETNAQSGKAITVDEAAQLISAASRIQAVLGCQ